MGQRPESSCLYRGAPPFSLFPFFQKRTHSVDDHRRREQIRAENLSGDCKFNREFTRRNWHFTKQHQACVRRRATLSVAANPNCPSREEAERVVNEVFESCWPDTRPFDEVRARSSMRTEVGGLTLFLGSARPAKTDLLRAGK